MDTSEIFKKVRKIEIKTRGLSNQIFSGQYHSSFKGKGMAFSEVREYQYGDDIRNIDWNVTARFNHPYVKIYDEERELTVMLLIDVSGSNQFGTLKNFKEDQIIEIAAVLSFSAIQNNDKVGVIFFSNKIEKFIPPQKGTTHILRIIRELIDFKPSNIQTNISEALRYFTNVIKKRSIAFIISDMIDDNFEDALKIAKGKHDVIVLQIYDQRETELPDIGMAKFKDNETGKSIWVDTSSRFVRDNYQLRYKNHENNLNRIFLRYGIDAVKIRCDEDYVKPLSTLFNKRVSRLTR